MDRQYISLHVFTEEKEGKRGKEELRGKERKEEGRGVKRGEEREMKCKTVCYRKNSASKQGENEGKRRRK